MRCFIYKSSKKDELYLYIAKQDDFSNIPQAILKSIGLPEFVMQLDITPERVLAREKATDVIKGIEENGFFIQMPATIYPAPKQLQ
ncbi:MAG: YcgL domain-containing protein [Gammaproteobacteria bacterium]|jgi:hypothetical protein|uniref:YcgL domain-containing protein n=1 Tax=Methyloprofundus sp. TaxID=2020875 RepID=UPI001A152C71|nr:YcgL domain-containing protein [Methyloprofundus sp.]MBT3813676.1 YcgL domain-containing protein [Gammaproteobacteria bacterium]HIL77684.1 YcgL domain-containing protein [Methylococcales bacterium]MBT5222391.1 YcgL domain-containing protein [Gammaproteobacteria bacterium]MBT5826143.1 YcgL domain-containing protein [Gammaproteobacteria bacterium]MBT6420675.1 YcgL domain-containing protein [Gammaproteobacteria bacterium]